MYLEKYDHFLFDLDGTIIDSFEDIKLSLENSYKAVLDTKISISRNQIGPPLREMIEVISPGLNEEDLQAIIREFRRNYDSSSYELTTEMEGAIQLLQRLFTSKRQLFLVTNKAYVPTVRILKKLDINVFKDVVAPDKFEDKKFTKTELVKFLLDSYQLPLGKTVMIGDTAHDVIAAKANSIDSISIVNGYDTVENLEGQNPTLIVKNISQLSKTNNYDQ